MKGKNLHWNPSGLNPPWERKREKILSHNRVRDGDRDREYAPRPRPVLLPSLTLLIWRRWHRKPLNYIFEVTNWIIFPCLPPPSKKMYDSNWIIFLFLQLSLLVEKLILKIRNSTTNKFTGLIFFGYFLIHQ